MFLIFAFSILPIVMSLKWFTIYLILACLCLCDFSRRLWWVWREPVGRSYPLSFWLGVLSVYMNGSNISKRTARKSCTIPLNIYIYVYVKRKVQLNNSRNHTKLHIYKEKLWFAFPGCRVLAEDLRILHQSSHAIASAICQRSRKCMYNYIFLLSHIIHIMWVLRLKTKGNTVALSLLL